MKKKKDPETKVVWAAMILHLVFGFLERVYIQLHKIRFFFYPSISGMSAMAEGSI